MPSRLLPLAFVLTLSAASCAEPPDPEIEFGSGQRFVPLVADSLNNAGVDPAVVVNEEGLPVAAYFAFEEATEEGQLPQARPVTAPTLPGVLMATVSADGIWTRGAMALESQVPNVSYPFAPGFDDAVANLTARNVTGLDVVRDGETVHAVWASVGGVYYATGSTDPAAQAAFRVSKVTSVPGVGPSIAVDGGTPWIAFYTSASPSGTVDVATPSGERWTVETVADAGGCDTCRTAVVATDGGPAVAYSEGGSGVAVSTNDGENGWVAQQVEAVSGEGLAATATPDGIALSYYAAGEVHVATGSPTGPFQFASAASVGEGSARAAGAGTSVAADDAGTLWVAWADAVAGVGFASGAEDGAFEAIDTGANTENGQTPDVAVTPDGTTTYLAWYDSENQDLLLGAYGDIEDLALANPSPEPSGPVQPVTEPGDETCAEPVDGVLDIVASGIAFDIDCVDAPAGEPVTIAFANEDEGIPHNVAIYPSADEITDPLFQGEVFNGVETREYPPVDPLDAGEYYFQCDVHPNMNGAWNVDGGGGGGDGGATGGTGPTGGGAITVVAQNVAFDTATIDLPADTESTITFDNQDAGVQHNIAIYPSADELADPLFQGDLITGPDEIDYPIPPLEAGEYYFHCDVHPAMNGTVMVA